MYGKTIYIEIQVGKKMIEVISDRSKFIKL